MSNNTKISLLLVVCVLTAGAGFVLGQLVGNINCFNPSTSRLGIEGGDRERAEEAYWGQKSIVLSLKKQGTPEEIKGLEVELYKLKSILEKQPLIEKVDFSPF